MLVTVMFNVKKLKIKEPFFKNLSFAKFPFFKK